MSASEEQIKKRHERNLEAYKLRQAGLTLQAVGDHFGVSRERARQMIRKITWLIEHPDSFWHKRNPELFQDEVFKGS